MGHPVGIDLWDLEGISEKAPKRKHQCEDDLTERKRQKPSGLYLQQVREWVACLICEEYHIDLEAGEAENEHPDGPLNDIGQLSSRCIEDIWPGIRRPVTAEAISVMDPL